jgi:hypothetical protein
MTTLYLIAIVASGLIALIGGGYIVSLMLGDDPAPPGWDEYPQDEP